MFDTLSHNSSAEIIENKTQRQLCKRLAGPFIPFSWSCLVWKRVSLWMWSLGGSQQPFSCVLGHFQHGDEQTNERTNNQVILVQACSWPVWERSLLQFDQNSKIQKIEKTAKPVVEYTCNNPYCIFYGNISPLRQNLGSTRDLGTKRLENRPWNKIQNYDRTSSNI